MAHDFFARCSGKDRGAISEFLAYQGVDDLVAGEARFSRRTKHRKGVGVTRGT